MCVILSAQLITVHTLVIIPGFVNHSTFVCVCVYVCVCVDVHFHDKALK